MNIFARKAILSLITLLPAVMPAAARDIITGQPEGNVKEYYADFQNFDNTFGFMGDYHTLQKIVFSEDGSKVYFPNLLLRRTMPAYVEGVLDAAEKTITVEAGQWVFLFPNTKIPVALYLLDTEGKAGSTSTTFYDEPLVFDIADDGTLTLRSSDQLPMFGLCNADNSEEVYQNATDLRFIPAENVDSQLQYCNYTYDSGSDETTAAIYHEGDDTIWAKGFVPKYPDAWVKITNSVDGWIAPSFQVQYYFATEDPVVFAATDGTDLFKALPVSVDAATGKITAADSDLKMCTATPLEGGSFEIYLTYSDLVITPTAVSLEKPSAPRFMDFEEQSTETYFKFAADATDTQGAALPKDCLAFRFFIDGKPYVFTTADYRWISSDMPLIPYTFDNYNFFSQGGSNNEVRYVYFQNLPADIETIAVESVYTLNDNEAVSDRLVYNVKTGQSQTTGIEDVIVDDPNAAPVYYDLQGRRVANPENGRLYLRRQGPATTKVIF